MPWHSQARTVPPGGAPRASLPLVAMLTMVGVLFFVPWGLGYLVAGTLTPLAPTNPPLSNGKPFPVAVPTPSNPLTR